MNRGFSWFFLLASGAFFVFIVGLTGYRVEDVQKRNTASAREHATSLAARVRSLRDITGSVQSPLFKTDMRDVIDGEPRLLLLSLHSPQNGIVYLVARARTMLKDPAQITPEWRGTPVYQVNRGAELLISSSLGSDMPGMSIDAVFVTIGKEDLYPIVRDDLYFFLAFLLVCGVAVLIAMSAEADAEPRRPSGGAASVPQQENPTFDQEPIIQAWEQPGARRGEEASGGLTSPRTGLVWGEYLGPRLKAELDRAASSDQDLSMACIRIDGPAADAHLHAEIAKLLKQSFPIHDLIFETGDSSYAVIMPDADVDASLQALEGLRRKLSEQPVGGRPRTLSIGVSSRGGRLVDDRVLQEEAGVALAKATREGGNQVIGFRADAARFREALAGKTT